MDDRDGERARRRRRASSPDPASISAGLGLGLGFGIQSTTSTTNNTMDETQSQGQPIDDQVNESMINVSAPRSTSSSTFSAMGPRPSNSLISTASTRGMFGRNIPGGASAAAQRENSHLSSSSSSTVMDGVLFHGQAGGTQKSRSSGRSRAKASVKASSTATLNRLVGPPTMMGISGLSATAPLGSATQAMTNPFTPGFPAATSMTASGSYATSGVSTTIGVSDANTSAGLSSAGSANNAPLNAGGVQNISNNTNATSANLPGNLPPHFAGNLNQLLNNISSGSLIQNGSITTVASRLAIASAQLRQQLNLMHTALNIAPMQNSQQNMQQHANPFVQVLAQAQALSEEYVGLMDDDLYSPPETEPELSAATTFHGFPHIPKELQVKIWKLLILPPRIIELVPKNITMTLEDESEITYERCVASVPHPVLLHVCHDSRFLAKKTYKLCLEEELKWPVYMDPNRDILLFPDTRAMDIFALSVPRVDCSTPPSLAHIKYIVLDPQGVLASLPDRENRPLTHTYPSYRFEEICAFYGSIKEIVVLKYPANHHLAPLPPQLNQAGIPNRDDVTVVQQHMRMLLRWAATMRPRRQPVPGGAGTGPGTVTVPAPGMVLPNLNQLMAAAGGAGGGGGGGGGWLAALFPAPGGQGGQGMANGGMNAGVNPGMQHGAPWSLPNITAMTLDELNERRGTNEA